MFAEAARHRLLGQPLWQINSRLGIVCWANTRTMANLIMPPEAEMASKSAWRKAFGRVLSQLEQKNITAQSVQATEKLISMPVYQDARSISVFLAMPNGELQTEGIVRHALKAGKNVFVPYIKRKPASMHMLRLEDEADLDSMQPDKWGIPSLNTETIDARVNCFGYRGIELQNQDSQSQEFDAGLDLVLLPCVAFDQEYNRLGHGKGYYDRFLTRYFETVGMNGDSYRKPYLIGLALAEQFLPDPNRLPMEEWDHKVDALLLGDRLLVRVPPASRTS
ncbi:putative 5-formyltetrahydrofolate cyclo-ligase [Elsinoe ampelina]|uniref:5-formyltetrahydrofolate cyclo-ligase n=1 Tax=Elsinoe ampelina TaxID=302913 RepID=A0A6A6G1X8_9PEZI|nr:putative 5-formyltetrahydrofolate cyclo-ligase [Elsinoe ampelina]